RCVHDLRSLERLGRSVTRGRLGGTPPTNSLPPGPPNQSLQTPGSEARLRFYSACVANEDREVLARCGHAMFHLALHHMTVRQAAPGGYLPSPAAQPVEWLIHSSRGCPG